MGDRGPRKPDGKRGRDLADLTGPNPTAQMWPTPNAHDPGFNPETLKPVDKEGNTPEHPNQRWYHPKTGRHVQKGLTQAAQMWPTPTAQDAKNDAGPSQWNRNSDPLNVAVMWPTPKSSPSGPDYARDGREASGGDDLATAVARWPTPTVGDARNSGHRNSATSRANPGLSLTDAALTGDSSTPRSAVTGSLNPNWVEWLQGFPVGWTDLEDSATPSSPSAPSGSDAESSPSTKSPDRDWDESKRDLKNENYVPLRKVGLYLEN